MNTEKRNILRCPTFEHSLNNKRKGIVFMFERKVWRLFAFFTPLSAPLCAFYVFCLSPNKFLLLFLFGVVPKTAFLLLFTPFPLRGGPKSSWPGGRPRHFFKHFWPSPETRSGTVVDSGPLPGDGRTNFAVAGPGAFWNVFGQIADHRRHDRERGRSSLAPGRPRAKKCLLTFYTSLFFAF